MESEIRLSKAQMDALTEVGSIGVGNASGALGQMIARRVAITVPRAYVLPIEEARDLFMEEDGNIVGLFFGISGEVGGNILGIFSEDQAMFIANTLLGSDSIDWDMTEERESALKELWNILASYYLAALSTFMGFNLMPSVPSISQGTTAAVIDPIIADMDKTVDHALIIDTEFILYKRAVVTGKFLTFFDRNAFNSMLEAIGMENK
jgi:chemotaxis protein CheC